MTAERVPVVTPRKKPVRANVTRHQGPASERPEPLDEGPREWHQRLQEVFGTLSPEFVEASLRQLMRVATLPNECIATSISLSSALALITSLAPKDEVEATLAIHIACLHMASLRVLGRTDHVADRRMIAMATAAARLERAFQTGIETYYRLRRGVTQIVRVERVEVQAGAQAIVGVVKRN